MRVFGQVVVTLCLIGSVVLAYPADSLDVADTVKPAAADNSTVDESILEFLGDLDWTQLRDRLPQDRVARLTVLRG